MRTTKRQKQIRATGKAVAKRRDPGPLATMAHIRLLQDGIDAGDVAQRLGLSRARVINWLRDDCPPGPLCFRFEAAMGYTLSLTTRPKDLRLRKSCLAALGYDPFTEARPALVGRARALGLRVSVEDSHRTLREAILRWAAGNPGKLSLAKTPPHP